MSAGELISRIHVSDAHRTLVAFTDRLGDIVNATGAESVALAPAARKFPGYPQGTAILEFTNLADARIAAAMTRGYSMDNLSLVVNHAGRAVQPKASARDVLRVLNDMPGVRNAYLTDDVIQVQVHDPTVRQNVRHIVADTITTADRGPLTLRWNGPGITQASKPAR